MKRINIIYILLSILLIAGCKRSSESDTAYEPDYSQSVIITMDLYSSATTRSTSTYALRSGVLGDAEYIIDRLRIYVFASDGSLDKMEYFDGLNANHLIGQTIEVPVDSSKELYFIANEPDLTEDLNAITSVEELQEIEFTIAESMNSGFNGADSFSSSEFLIPMTASYNVENAMSDINIYVGLTRAVARVDLYLRKGNNTASRTVKLNSTTRLAASGATYDSYLFTGNVGEPSDIQSVGLTSSDITLSTSSYERVLSFYTAERTYNYLDPDSKITFEIDGLYDGDDKIESKSVTLGDGGGLTQINRNNVYQIYGSYNVDEIVADSFEIMEWEDVEVDAEIEGVMVAVESEVAMDWLLNGNTYTSKSISFGSNKALSFYLPVTTTTEDDPTPDYEFELFEFENMSAGSTYNLKEIDLANNYIFATSWIESATIHFTSSQSGYIEFVYTPVKVNYKIQSYPIRIKSDNVTKQMKAVYDNGYLPATLLSDDWAKRAPGGVVFAKRGEAKHPLTTPEILHRDDDGYYRGEYALTAEQGTTYCSETFGGSWYMPTYADMMEIASMFDMLGVSYRFQNNGSAENSALLTESRYWTSSASSTYQGQYWSANFMSREYMMDELMERRDGENLYFVRCVMDLQ